MAITVLYIRELSGTVRYLLEKPALSFRREEGVHQVIIRFIGDLERFLFDVPVNNGELRKKSMKTCPCEHKTVT
jgi:hypothetical protein